MGLAVGGGKFAVEGGAVLEPVVGVASAMMEGRDWTERPRWKGIIRRYKGRWMEAARKMIER
jgi:hypothetical protein